MTHCLPHPFSCTMKEAQRAHQEIQKLQEEGQRVGLHYANLISSNLLQQQGFEERSFC